LGEQKKKKKKAQKRKKKARNPNAFWGYLGEGGGVVQHKGNKTRFGTKNGLWWSVHMGRGKKR